MRERIPANVKHDVMPKLPSADKTGIQATVVFGAHPEQMELRGAQLVRPAVKQIETTSLIMGINLYTQEKVANFLAF
jgi:hypothetical protein